MNIKMFDVNFGETIIYQEGIHKLLVDCGAKYHNKGKLAYKRIKKEIDQNTMLMITHFDEDHYNGILEIPRNFHFRKVFLPLYIYEKGKQSNTMEVFIDTLYVWTYMMAIGKKKKIDSLHKLFLTLPKLVNSIYDIRCVGKDELPKKAPKFGNTITKAFGKINIPMQVEKVTIHTSIPQKHDIIYSHPASKVRYFHVTPFPYR